MYNTDVQLLYHFNDIKDSDEKILWRGKPVFIPFVLSGLGIWPWAFLFGLAIIFITLNYKSDYDLMNGRAWLLGLIPISQSLWFFIKRILTYRNTLYAYSDRRIIIQTGIIGLEYKSIGYKKVNDVHIKVSLIEKVYHVGTIKFFTGTIEIDEDISKLYDTLSSIPLPYTIFNDISIRVSSIQR